jgi:hypothetical protein
VIKRVNQIGAKKKQGQTFRFLNQRAEPYEWTDKVPEDDSEFQGLLDKEETAPYPDISAEPPGVELESEESDQNPTFVSLQLRRLIMQGSTPLKGYRRRGIMLLPLRPSPLDQD